MKSFVVVAGWLAVLIVASVLMAAGEAWNEL